MSEKKNQTSAPSKQSASGSAGGFMAANGKKLALVGSAVLLILLGVLFYFTLYIPLFVEPREEKATVAMFRAEEYFRKDSVRLALNGDGQNLGFLGVISRHSGTKAANLAYFYAGSCYLKMDSTAKAIEYLSKFSTSSKGVQARAYKLLGDAYGDSGKNKEALDAYKKAARHFEKDEVNSPDYLFLAAYFADQVMQDSKEAIALYEEIREKYPRSQQSYDAEKYLARLGVYQSPN